ncbi:GMC family oxidoreductase [Streptomyces sp. AK02-01A]|uniref:GMC family oxidoreductase n=1 Tax=Streptomyces sp. AK02-01A TaxID=3028648 RepID=UPI0029AC04D6|nr:GMC family oxidoreductase N-terminal domain-containing protein [Streptomyces sp. AK02-01A]MDX3851810.1 GMC family oxidoreductase N-terminal domain-containing protein [Streptomyces sp. AK02-01A]
MLETERVEHEYVVVGAGSSGSVIARRLLDRGHSVHILEAGPEDTSELVHNPSSWPALFDSELDWAVRTVPQKHAKDRSVRMPRGKVLGGCASVNGMIYMRGVRSDYDAWSYGGATGWDWESVFPYFLKSEDHEDGASRWHGAGGLQPVCRIHDPHPTAAAFVDAAVSSGFPKTDDFNGEHPLGAGFNQITTRDGRRMSSWQSFVAPVRERPEVTVTTLALARRLLFDGDRAVGVEYSVRGEPRRAYASAEVVLSAGVIGSPKLLLLSGIGPAEHLRNVGIDVRHDVPGVGENLHDHLLISNIYESTKPLPPGRYNLLESQLYWKSDPRLLGPDLQPIFLHRVYPADGYPMPEHGYTIAPGILRPLSRGHLRLAGADPERAPLVDPRVLEAPHDLETLVDAVEICREIGHSSAFREWRKAEVAPGPATRTRDDLREYVRSAATTYHHQVGTCRMGQDPMSVVDPELRVNGVRSLRVADASVMPAIPSGNTHAPSMMIGEKAADLILADA